MGARRHRTTLIALGLTGAMMATACSRAPDPNVAAGVGATTTTVFAPLDGGDGFAAPEVDENGTPIDPAVATPLDPSGNPITTVPGQTAPPTPGSPGAAPAPGTPGTPTGGPTTTVAASTPARSTLFSPGDNVRGITKDKIVMCAHAALTYAAAFNTGEGELNVYWEAVNEAGGIFGRKVEVYYENDNYDSATAQQAATACKDNHDPFMLIGGIGFDQIPGVRTWAENNKTLYIHHTATEQGTEDKRHSFTALPTTEKMGTMFAELAGGRYKGKKVGIVKRGSPNWEPGIVGFKRKAKELGIEIVYEQDVPVNARNYVSQIIDMQAAGAELAFIWLNALESTEFITQSKAQGYSPQFLVFPFNLITQTLGDAALEPPLAGVAMFNGYSYGDRSGPFAAYADDLDLFEAQYAKYQPDADLKGLGGDLLFLNWTAQKATHDLFLRCGADCNRNRFVDVLQTYKNKPSSSVCEIDFTRPTSANGHRGGFAVSILQAYKAPDGTVNFRNTDTCVEKL